MSKDALKFYHSFIFEMIDVMGENMPKVVASRLGAKLAKYYKKLGVSSIEEGLIKSYNALGGSTEIENVNSKTLEVKIKYIRKFCPIGGKPNPEKAEVIQKSICIPFSLGFITEIDHSFKYEGEVKECILNTNKRTCNYILHLEKKS